MTREDAHTDTDRTETDRVETDNRTNSTEVINSGFNGIEDRICDDWRAFKLNIHNELFNEEPDAEVNGRQSAPYERGKFIFRGQGSSTWPLEPTFDRWFPGPIREKPIVAKALLEYFMKELQSDEDLTDEEKKDRLRKLGIAQHHGLPTRLLDWTESPYIAAFFAFSGLLDRKGKQEVGSNDYVAVWVLDTERSIFRTRSFGVEIIDLPAASNYRLRRQTAKFTNFTTDLYGTLEELVHHYLDRQPEPESQQRPILIKYLLPENQVNHALADLDLMGINYARLFKDREGYALAAKMSTALKHGWRR